MWKSLILRDFKKCEAYIEQKYTHKYIYIYIYFISVERNIELLKLIHTDLRENFKS